MTSLVALSISIGVLGAVATWLALGPLSAVYQVWIGFIAWATFFATGGNNAALKTTIVSGIWGAICAWVALLIIATVPVEGLGIVWPAIVVGVTVIVLCLGAHVEALANIPAGVYGYAATAGLTLLSNKLNVESLAAVGPDNPLVVAVISIIVGAVFGLLSGKLAGMLGKG
ncbi:MAG: DUF1097 domain-containing protein [Alphaproteobacteria bacterium]